MSKGARRCSYFTHDYAAQKKERADRKAAEGDPEAEAAILARYGWERREDGSCVCSNPPNRKTRRATAKVFRKPKNKGGRK